MYDIIEKKKHGEVLSDSEIEFFVKGYTEGTVPDYQASALCMAICFRGMTDGEIYALTDCMMHSGQTVDLSPLGDRSVDKHSTGGVGDKTTLIVAPIAASLGAKVSKMSGRGLGHTGGTVDKLSSIPGFRTSLSEEDFIAQVKKVGVAVIGQTADLTPADKKLYALRDVTATVDSIPLIASSVMCKKLAVGSRSVVLDVKVGSGAFLKTPEEAEKLARCMVGIGKNNGRRMAALITDMDEPLGDNVGNVLEVKEAVSVLRDGKQGNLKKVCVALATQMVSLSLGLEREEAERRVNEAISSGLAYEKMKEWIGAQGGDVSYIEDTSKLASAEYQVPVLSESDGFIISTDALKVGTAAALLGAGRISKETAIDYSAGIVLAKQTGDYVKKGDVLCTLHTSDESRIAQARDMFLSSVSFGDEKPAEKPLIYKSIT